jgi:hypothetical protein
MTDFNSNSSRVHELEAEIAKHRENLAAAESRLRLLLPTQQRLVLSKLPEGLIKKDKKVKKLPQHKYLMALIEQCVAALDTKVIEDIDRRGFIEVSNSGRFLMAHFPTNSWITSWLVYPTTLTFPGLQVTLSALNWGAPQPEGNVIEYCSLAHTLVSKTNNLYYKHNGL